MKFPCILTSLCSACPDAAFAISWHRETFMGWNALHCEAHDIDLHSTDHFLEHLLTHVIHTEQLGEAMTAFIEAQPAIDAVTATLADAQAKATALVAQLAQATADKAAIQTQLDAANAQVAQLQADAANQSINLTDLQTAAQSVDTTVTVAPA